LFLARRSAVRADFGELVPLRTAASQIESAATEATSARSAAPLSTSAQSEAASASLAAAGAGAAIAACTALAAITATAAGAGAALTAACTASACPCPAPETSWRIVRRVYLKILGASAPTKFTTTRAKSSEPRCKHASARKSSISWKNAASCFFAAFFKRM
jgi:hypothetical protein